MRPHRAWRRLAAALLARIAAGILLAAGAAAPPAAADDSLARIARTGRLVVGANDAAAPISYAGPTGEHIGFQMDVCQRVVAALRRHLQLAELRVVTVPVLMSTRTAMLDNGTVDMDCGLNPISNAALRQSLLSHATLAYELRLMTLAEKGSLHVADLDGRSVGQVVGSATVPRLRALARSSRFRMTEVFVRDASDALELLDSGRVDAFSSSLPVLLGLRAAAPDAARYALLDVALGVQYVAIAFRLADEDMRNIANDVIVSLARTGELRRLYDKWFLQPIPGALRPVGAPITPAQLEIIGSPGSEMLGL